MNKNKTKIKFAAPALAALMLLTACGSSDEEQTQTSSSETTEQVLIDGDDLSDVSIYTGREVENEEDLAIFKFNCELPAGYEAVIDNAEGKQYASPNGAIVVKAQNFKEEFQSLEIFADQGCAAIKMNNMMYQADTEFSEPQKTTVGGFDAIMYDYTVTAYVYKYETDANGENVLDDDGNPVLTDETEVYGEYVNRVYYFYSDEDAFYIICESTKDNAEAAAKEFDEFISTVTITKK